MTRYKLIIEYFGRDYAGWQRQDRVPTIQQEIEEAIFKFSGQKVLIQGAGRTDAGVHARGQVAHVDLEPFSKPMSGFEIAKAINAHLRPRAISIIHVEPAPEDFHARFSANNKLYHYRIVNRSALLALDQGLSWHIKRRLDVAAMHEAAQYLVGTHDFTSFRDTACQAKSPEKSLLRLDVTSRPCDEHGGQEILIAAEGRSFLHHQVRNMVGTLSLVGEGKWNPQDVQSVLQAKARTKSGPTAPAEGLYLMRIDY